MVSVTVVPRPGAEETRTRSQKLCITAKPRPARSSPPVVYSGSIAFSMSGMPQPRSRILTTTRLSARIFAVMYTVPIVSR